MTASKSLAFLAQMTSFLTRSSVGFSEVSELKSSYDCGEPDLCGPGLFCGSNLKCHPYSCSNWYEYANANFTDYDPSLPLSCDDVLGQGQYFPGLNNAAVVFGCTGFPASLPSPPKAVYQPFTKRCWRANEGEKQAKFECYEMADGTDFQPFVQSAISAQLDPCEPPYQPDVPSFIYQVVVELNDNINNYRQIVIMDTGNATTELNITRAMGAMYANLTITKPPPTSLPTISPTKMPTAPNSAQITSSKGRSTAMLVLGTTYSFYFFMRPTKK